MRKFIMYGIIVILFSLLISNQNTNNTLDEISKEEVRLRIIANSDSKEDQEIKQKVREQSLLFLEKILKNENSGFEIVINKIKVNIILLEDKIKEITQDASINFEKHIYPVKLSENQIEYEREVYTLLIKINKAAGSNYFTTLYPNFIKKDEEQVVFESFFQNILDKLKNGG